MLAKSVYVRLFDACSIRPSMVPAVERIIERIIAHRSEYEQIAEATGFPWYAIAVIHYRESTLSFDRHLHNGDKLTARTHHVPAGRPLTGTPPFTFVESAIDALTMMRMTNLEDISIGNLLRVLENYNGTGYQKRGINTPYLWSFTDRYSKGKYIADGVFSATTVDGQCGVAAILLRMHQRGIITLSGTPISVKLAGKEVAIPAFTVWGNTYVGARALATALGGTIVEMGQDPFRITFSHKGKTGEFIAHLIGVTGYVDAGDVLNWFGRTVTMADGDLSIGGAK